MKTGRPEEPLGAGDLVVDGGNSNLRDSLRHAGQLAERGIGFVDAGVSGGVWGLEEGYCIMAGGSEDDIAHLQPVLDDLVAEGGFAHVGPVGTGHFTKMVHNGVEYGLMQAYAEGYEMLRAGELDVDVPAAIEVWRHGSVVRSWLPASSASPPPTGAITTFGPARIREGAARHNVAGRS